MMLFNAPSFIGHNRRRAVDGLAAAEGVCNWAGTDQPGVAGRSGSAVVEPSAVLALSFAEAASCPWSARRAGRHPKLVFRP
jgi:hypothetical protein